MKDEAARAKQRGAPARKIKKRSLTTLCLDLLSQLPLSFEPE